MCCFCKAAVPHVAKRCSVGACNGVGRCGKLMAGTVNHAPSRMTSPPVLMTCSASRSMCGGTHSFWTARWTTSVSISVATISTSSARPRWPSMHLSFAPRSPRPDCAPTARMGLYRRRCTHTVSRCHTHRVDERHSRQNPILEEGSVGKGQVTTVA